ncbi:unnamed protein product, partial [Ascophyllum nodosum]
GSRSSSDAATPASQRNALQRVMDMSAPRARRRRAGRRTRRKRLKQRNAVGLRRSRVLCRMILRGQRKGKITWVPTDLRQAPPFRSKGSAKVYS